MGQGHRILLVTETRCPPVPRLRTHGDGCAPGTTWGGLRLLTAYRHRWRRHTSWVPHSHGLGRWWQVEGSLGALSASLPWDLPGKVPRCGVAAPLVVGPAGHTTRLAPPRVGGGVGAAKGLLLCFVVPKGNQPTACTLALWWLKFGPTETPGGGGVADNEPPAKKKTNVRRVI